MSIAKITLYGLYKYDSSLFDDLVFPESDLLVKQTAVDQILLDCGEFEVLYPDWDFLKLAITQWGKKWFYTFQKWVEALEVEYDPLENYNRVEHWEDDNTRNTSVNSSATINTDNEYHVRKRTYDNNTMTETDNSSGETDTTNDLESTGEEEVNNVRDGYAKGNIGVTTSQQMLQSSLELYRGFNLYEEIANIFKTELVLPIYE